MKTKHNPTFYFALLALLLASLACTINVGGPEVADAPVPISAEAVQSLEQEIKAAWAAGEQTGVVTLRMNETQITSYLELWLATQSNPLFASPQVYLRDGQMRIYGKARQGYFEANIGIIVQVGVSDEGKPKIEILTADFGPWPAPSELNQVITAVITEAYTGVIGPAATGLRIETVSIADGVMTLTGRIR